MYPTTHGRQSSFIFKRDVKMELFEICVKLGEWLHLTFQSVFYRFHTRYLKINLDH